MREAQRSDRVVESLHHRVSASIGFAGKVHGESGSSGRTHIDADMRIEWLQLQQYSQVARYSGHTNPTWDSRA